MNAAADFLRFDGVAIRLGGREILSPTSFDVARGEFVCIVGPSGCGKTTLLSVIAGLLDRTAGEIHVLGVDTATLSGARRDHSLPTHVVPVSASTSRSNR